MNPLKNYFSANKQDFNLVFVWLEHIPFLFPPLLWCLAKLTDLVRFNSVKVIAHFDSFIVFEMF